MIEGHQDPDEDEDELLGYGDGPTFIDDGDILDRPELFYGQHVYGDIGSREGASTPELMMGGRVAEHGYAMYDEDGSPDGQLRGYPGMAGYPSPVDNYPDRRMINGEDWDQMLDNRPTSRYGHRPSSRHGYANDVELNGRPVSRHGFGTEYGYR